MLLPVLSSEFCEKITDPIHNLVSIATNSSFLILLRTDKDLVLYIYIGKSENRDIRCNLVNKKF